MAKAASSETTSLSFMNDLGFFAGDKLVEEVASFLEKIREAVLRWETSNIVIYEIAKTQAIFFF